MKNLSDCRVLLADDAKAYLDILVEGLASDHKLSLALSGEMALEAAARTPPDLVLLDMIDRQRHRTDHPPSAGRDSTTS